VEATRFRGEGGSIAPARRWFRKRIFERAAKAEARIRSMGDVQEAELEIPLRRFHFRRSLACCSISASKACSVCLCDPRLHVRFMHHGRVPPRRHRRGRALIDVIRQGAPNQFRKSGMLLVPQPSLAQKR
jgi:hypothetical protein